MYALVLALSAAQAQTSAPPYSIDVELLRPAFGHGGFSGVDAPIANRDRTFRYGMLVQYEQAPLTLYEAVEQRELGAVVTNRFSGMMGASIDLDRTTLSILVPTAGNWGTELPSYGRDGFGLGDVGGNVRVIALRTPRDRLNLGGRAGIILPTGRPNAYVSEGRVRFGLGVEGAVSAGPFVAASDLGLATRSSIETSEDFVASNEVTWGNALRWRLPDASRLGLQGQILTRSGLSRFLSGGAETSVEALGGVELYPTRRATVTVAAGRGLTQGYGTTDFRMLSGVTFAVPPREPARVEWPQPRATDTDDPDVVPPIPDDVPIDFNGGLVVRLPKSIEIRDQIRFVVDTDVLLEESEPTLVAVAGVINADPLIGHVLIEGHASSEGSHEHNYQLADARARRIWEFLLAQGVARERISYCGVGEVEPVEEAGHPVIAEDEASLQKNRRVRFLVVHEFAPDELPDYPDTQVLPWSGEIVDVVQPPPPQVEDEPEDGVLPEVGEDEP